MWERIVLHHTVTSDGETLLDLEAIRRYHMEQRGWSDIGYHWVVEKVGGVYAAIMARPAYRTGSHTKGRNTGSLGVALVGNWSRFPPPEAMLFRTAELCAVLCRMNGIPKTKIYRHSDFRPTLCPGKIDVERIREMVGRLRGGRYPRADDL
ncbi:MAG: peptidoglycan recognition family protein [Longimicrobiales bacterium]|nr:peptidoglycan recognition family protein [Longimicrobiales bacterium]